MDITCTILDSGDLRLSVDPETAVELREALRESYWQAFGDLMESESCNGGFTPFDAGQANPAVGLTSAPCIAESMDYDDDGRATINGRFWWFPDYAIRDPLDELARDGETVFAFGGNTEEESDNA